MVMGVPNTAATSGECSRAKVFPVKEQPPNVKGAGIPGKWWRYQEEPQLRCSQIQPTPCDMFLNASTLNSLHFSHFELDASDATTARSSEALLRDDGQRLFHREQRRKSPSRIAKPQESFRANFGLEGHRKLSTKIANNMLHSSGRICLQAHLIASND
ncbi:hypothetical protein Efla_007506 [Eimeria flavescens]